MSDNPMQMEGTARFYPFAYLRIAAHNAFQTAQANPLGSNYQRISAVLFSAFAVEAHLNHVGENRLPFWSIVEPKLPWRAKLDLIAQQLGFDLDFGSRPFQTIIGVFRFRDRMAHGKTWADDDVKYQYTGSGEEESECLDPGWLRVWWDDNRVRRALEDADAVMTAIHRAAGFDTCTIWLMGDGEFAQQ
ncbi:MAG: hypothetical protein ACYC35_07575 [Pirellulales bacterium]